MKKGLNRKKFRIIRKAGNLRRKGKAVFTCTAAVLLLSLAACGGAGSGDEAEAVLSGSADSASSESADVSEKIRIFSDGEDSEEDGEEDGDLFILSGEDSRETESGSEIEEEDGAEDHAVLIFAGDVLLQDNITQAWEADGLDGILSSDLQEELFDADLLMVNEEFPFGTGGEPDAGKQYTFQADPFYVEIFQEMGVDIVSLANNHVLDYGQDVLSQTFDILDEAGIAYAGAGETLERAMEWESFDLDGTKVGILCASRVYPSADWDVRNSQPGVFSTYDETLLVEQIEAAKEENDLVIVYVHWGVEKEETPEDYQRALAQAYIDAGADLVIGCHPHVLQGIEYYEGVPIVYSLGNFLFNEAIDQTALLKVYLDEEDGLALQLIAAEAENSLTRALSGEEEEAVYEYVESISCGARIDDEGYVSQAEEGD